MEPGLQVSMPYLPVYVLLFLPLTALEITHSYLVFALANSVGLGLYLLRFTRAMQVPLSGLRLLQWAICLPVLANLYLGQMNLLLVISLGEFVLALVRGQEKRSGLWLGVILMKPHTLILLLPGLLVSRRWKVWLGFGAGAAAILAGSLLLGGVQGVLESGRMAARFAGPLIQTAPMIKPRLASMALFCGGTPRVASWHDPAGVVFLVPSLGSLPAGAVDPEGRPHAISLSAAIPCWPYLDSRVCCPSISAVCWSAAGHRWHITIQLAATGLGWACWGWICSCSFGLLPY
jgi:hypothetical protein